MAMSASIFALIFLAALLASSVGNAGASSYLAVMAVFGLSPEVIRPSALVLNVLVATVALIRFRRAGLVRWSLVGPIALGSIPSALLGGMIHLPGSWYRVLAGALLIFSADRVARQREVEASAIRPLPGSAPVLGLGIGLVSGLTGIGGGVLLGPLLIVRRWAEPREAAGASAALNLANSLAALVGDPWSVGRLPPAFSAWAAAALLGGMIGSGLGARKLAGKTLRRILAFVLVLAGVRLLVS